uniref:Uncharacterized protein n=1 Tax=Romanomermis culicivorax TaxID=13658 RepID=A0A915J6Y4_ROMCU
MAGEAAPRSVNGVMLPVSSRPSPSAGESVLIVSNVVVVSLGVVNNSRSQEAKRGISDKIV